MATPGHLSYNASVGYKKNFDRDVHADTGIFNRLKVHDLVTNDTTIVDNMCFPNGTAAAPSITFCNDLATGLYRTAAGNVGVADSGIPLAAFDSATPHGLIVGDATVNMAHLSSIQLTSGLSLVSSNTNIAETPAVLPGSTDAAGTVTWNDGSAMGAPGAVTITVSYAAPYVTNVPSVIIEAGNASTAAIFNAAAYFVTSNLGSFVLNFTGTNTTNPCRIHYKVIGYI